MCRLPVSKLLIRSLILLSLGVIGCSHNSPELGVFPSEINLKKETAGALGWWYVSFFIDWPEGEPPFWYLDGLIADQIVRPVLQRHREQLHLWRFHRRASRNDAAGHRFSFIFYAEPEVAESINSELARQELLIQLLDQGFVQRVGYDETDQIPRPTVAGTSDRSWPEVIQDSWPSYIMGASQMWLDLVHQVAADNAAGDESEMTQVYQKTDEVINQLWRFQAQHAFFHHLNALFGYQDMLFVERKAMRF